MHWIFILFFSSFVFAQSSDYETVVEDIIFNSSSKVVIDEQTIKDSNAPDIISLITTQANVTLFNNNFQPPQIFLRGGESSHILILVDGVPVYDVSWAQRTLNLNSLNIANVRRIEIIKGGQTVLHGGQALAGVIKIETFGAEFKKRNQVYLTQALLDRPDTEIGITTEKISKQRSGFIASARLEEQRTQSPVLHSTKLYKKLNRNLDLSYETHGATKLRARAFYFRDKSTNPTTVNGASGQSVADSDVVRQDDQLGISGQLIFSEIAMKPRLSVFAQQGWRYFYSPSTSANVDAKFRSKLHGVLLDLTPVETLKLKVNSGLSYQKEDYFFGDPKATLNSISQTVKEFSELKGVYTMAQINAVNDALLLEAGARLEKASDFTEKPSYQIGLTIYKNTKLEWVTGYRAPATSQIKGVFPNANLKPEISQTYSATQDFHLNGKGELSATLFETSFDNYIEARSIGAGLLQYQNTAKVKTRGIEITSNHILNPKQNVQMAYAYQEPWDQVRHERLRRRPLVSGSARIFHKETYSTYMLEGTGVGERRDFFGPNRYTFPGYFLLNAAVNYQFRNDMSVALRADNILDFRPEISIDYYGEGRNLWVTLLTDF